ncbi:RAB6-interacting golgin-like [Gigantopelta aegis]|uniref:RAB6-interacting golgin-like n=1 Tax=Gigantopelta aegis TaxID=1735272 RepID=UPI001B88AA56|nr:RAB6-interacting golgin-like [Gigantopelta aegis]
MAGWAGFTEEDLRILKVSVKDSHGVAKKPAQLKRPRTARSQFVSQFGESPEPVLHPSQRLSQPQTTDKLATNKTDKAAASSHHGNTTTTDVAAKIQNKDGQHPVSTDSSVASDNVKVVRELDEVEAISVDINKMETFQKQQKMIQEANKQKREYLTKTISERQKKAKAENAKLTKIQRELSHLDDLLSTDVGIIRDKIEEASLQYQEAQRKYEKAEQDFIKAKMNLFEKGETKEQLTEHLYTIINQNEVRKAKKLAELMKQLEMEISLEEMEIQIPAIPPLMNFNSVHTINSPLRKMSDVPSHQNHGSGGSLSGGTSEKQGNIQQVTNEKQVNIQQSTNEKAGNIQHSTNEHAAKTSNVTSENGVNMNAAPTSSDVSDKTTLLQMCTLPGSQSESCGKDQIEGSQRTEEVTDKTSGLTDPSTPAVKDQHAENKTVESNSAILSGADNTGTSSSKNGIIHDTNQNCLSVNTAERAVPSSYTTAELNNNGST